MTMTLTDRFMQALKQAETSGNLAELLELHSDSVNLRNLTEQTWEGREGAREFWESYLSNFQEIQSEFTAHQELNGLGVMEWDAQGKLKDGRRLHYRGISLLEIEDDRIKAFRTYYDSAAFVLPATI